MKFVLTKASTLTDYGHPEFIELETLEDLVEFTRGTEMARIIVDTDIDLFSNADGCVGVIEDYDDFRE